MNRRHALIATGSFAVAGLTVFTNRADATENMQSGIPPGGVAQIIEGGIVQFDYPDGTMVRVYDDRLEVIRPNQKPEIRPNARINIEVASLPAIPGDPTLVAWLDTLAGDLRETIRQLVRNRGASNKHYDDMENDFSLTVYKKIILRYKYVNRLLGFG
jgi:hypothetical protein